mgnify:CR=1 FL=1
MIESEKHIERRHRMMDEIARRSTIDAKVIEAMKQVPRQLFIDSRLEEKAYDDRPLPIAAGQTISQIYTVAMQTNLLDLEKGASVLEIGTGSGYQAAVLCELGYKVYSIERHKKLHLTAKQILEKLGYKALLFHSDGFKGLPKYAPYDGVLITCGAPEVPKNLINQLAVNRKMAAPIGRGLPEMTAIHKINDKEKEIAKEGTYRFVPMLPGIVDK